jgi:uncharacterized RDD family membrane protein YckC
VTTPTVTLQSITGVDVELRIAGPGTRSYAFVIDWHIRLLLALAWLLVALILYNGGFNFTRYANPRTGWYFLVVVLPPTAIYFLYHPVLEVAMRGRTPGKRMAGVRLVSRTGDIPSVGALLLRNMFRLIDSLPFVYLVGLATVMFTSQHVRVGDLAAGTLLVMDGSENDKSFASFAHASGLDPEVVELVQELLDRWSSLDEATRANIGRSLLTRIDPATPVATLMLENSAQLRVRLQSLLNAGKAA